MYNLISIIFLIVGIFSIGKSDFNWIVFLFSMSVGFSLAGSIGSLSSSIDNLLNCKIKYNKKDFINGDSEIIFKKEKDNANYNSNNK